MSEADMIIKSLKNSGKKVEEFYMNNKTSDENVANVEEDVKVLKDLMKELKLEKQTALHNNEYGEYITECDVLDLYDMQILALQHILAELEQKDKRIKELEKALLKVKDKNTTLFITCRNSIPEQAVIDKINEYDKKMEEDAGHPHWVVTDRIVMNVLQELLEGRNENG